MGNKLALVQIVVVYIFCFSLHATISFSFVISPSQIDVPVLNSNSTFVLDIVSDVRLDIRDTNCTTVHVLVRDNALELQVPTFATTSIESCIVTVVDLKKPSVSFSFPLIIRINSSLVANMTIAYDATNLFVTNKGSGGGILWINQSNKIETCALNPTESCSYTPRGRVVVCSNALCAVILFDHTFAQPQIKSEEIGEEFAQGDGGFWLGLNVIGWLALLIFGVVTITYVIRLRYFPCRNRTFLKNTR